MLAALAAALQIVGIALAGSALVGVAPASATPANQVASRAASSSYGWTPQGAFPVTFNAIACPSNQMCLAVGSQISQTQDGGLVWTEQQLPSSVNALSDIVCVSTSVCWASGQSGTVGVVLATSDGGAHWATETIPSGTSAVTGMSCVNVNDCWAVTSSGAIIATTDGGADWVTQTTPTYVNNLVSISCTSTTQCSAIGVVASSGSASATILSSSNGQTWTPVTSSSENTSIASVSTATGISCVAGSSPGTVQCLASLGGGGVAYTPDAYNVSGPTWTIASSAPTGSTFNTECVTASACWAAGSGGVISFSTDGGNTWTQQAITTTGPAQPSAFFSIACTDANTCWAAGSASDAGGKSGYIVATTDGGSNWGAQQTYPLSGALNGVSCTSTSDCWMIGGSSGSGAASVSGTTNGGQTWSALGPVLSLPTGGSGTDMATNFAGISCLPGTGGASDCWIAGVDQNGQPVIEDTEDGGQTWNYETTVPGAVGALTAITCPTTSDCWAVSANGLVIATVTGGASWTTQTLPTGYSGFNSIGCANTSQCWIGGASNKGAAILATVNGGALWKAQATGGSGTGQTTSFLGGTVTGIACPSTSECFAATDGGMIYSTTDGGLSGGWSLYTQSNGSNSFGGGLSAITCFSTADCWAVGAGGSGAEVVTTRDGGTTWIPEVGAATTPSSGTGISCPTALDCWYVGSGGVANTTNGGAEAPPVVSSVTPAGGPIGTATTVTVKGKYFLDTESVSFVGSVGGSYNQTAAFVVTSDTSMTVTSPPDPTPQTVDIIVTSLGGVSLTSPQDQYVYGAAASAPTITKISPASGPTAGGNKVVITGLGFGSAISVSFGSNVVPFSGISETSGANGVDSIDVGSVPPSTNGSLGPVTVVVSTAGGGASQGGPGSTYVYVDPGAYTPITPTRICDTRPNNPSGLTNGNQQCDNGTLRPGATRHVEVAGLDSIPSLGVTAVVVNVTVASPSASGYLTVYPTGAAIPPSSNINFTAGDDVANLAEVELGQGGQLSFYNGSAGTTNVIVDVEGYVGPQDGTSLYTSISPVRICDTRANNPSNLSGGAAQCNGTPITTASPLTVQVTGLDSIPSDATAAVLNVTMVHPLFTPGGQPAYMTVYPGDAAQAPMASNVNATAGAIVPNRVIVPLASDGSGTIKLAASATTDAIVDVSGYFQPVADGLGTQFTPTSPARIVDSRCVGTNPPTYCAGEGIPTQNGALAALGPGGSMTVQVAGVGNVPSSATAVVANVTVIGGTSPSYLTVYPGGTGSSPPVVSDLNWASGETVPNLVVAMLSPSGTITIYNAAGTVNVAVDIMGWYQ